MTKRSTATVRETPLEDVSASSGGFAVYSGTIAISTTDRLELVDVTERVMDVVRRSGVREGTVNLVSLHTTCAVIVNETQPALHADIMRFLEQTVSRDDAWMHNDPKHSDCDRMNADSHLRAMLLGHSLTLQIAGGELVLGQWQRVLVAELDGPRHRSVRLQAMGLGA